MPTIRYRLVNVLAASPQAPFSGNPLAVIEDGSALSDAEMQLVARQFNLSETTFLLPSERASAAFVHACQPDPALVARYSANARGQGKAYVFARTADGFESRYFWMPGSSLAEDPGTGSACANLGGWWLATQGAVPLHATVHQGTAMGRPNVLTLDVEDGAIQVGGRVVDIGAGTLRW